MKVKWEGWEKPSRKCEELLPFHGLVGVVAKPSSSSVLSSPAYLTSSLSSRRVAVTFMSSRPATKVTSGRFFKLTYIAETTVL